MKRGDGTEFWVCNGCGRIPIYNEAESLFVCPTCDGPLEFTGLDAATMTMQLPTKASRTTFSRVAMPYVVKLLDQELTTLGNIGMRFVTEGPVGRLRDAAWPWPSESFKVDGAGGAVVAGETVNPEARAAAEAEAEAAAAAAKPVRKKGGAAAAVAGPEGAPAAGEEAGAADVLAAAVEAAGDAAVVAGSMAGAVRFYSKLQNEYRGFSNFAETPFSVDNRQEPAPGGAQYPDFKFTVAGGSTTAGGGPAPSAEAVARLSGDSLSALGMQGPGTTWPTVEHYYQAMKFPDDPEWQTEILQAMSPSRAKKLGLSRDHPLRGDWDVIKERVMKKALLAKFRQNPGLLDLLQKTGDKSLVEASPSDTYWGAGRNGKGKNRLGALLGEVRAELADVRLDAEVIGGLPPIVVADETEGDGEIDGENLPEDVAAAAAETVAAATGGTVQMQGAAGGVQGGGGAGAGVVMIINPQMGAAMERSRNSRARSRSRNSRISWSGMSVQRDGDGEGGYLMVGGGSGGSEQITTAIGNQVEVTVEKLG